MSLRVGQQVWVKTGSMSRGTGAKITKISGNYIYVKTQRGKIRRVTINDIYDKNDTRKKFVLTDPDIRKTTWGKRNRGKKKRNATAPAVEDIQTVFSGIGGRGRKARRSLPNCAPGTPCFGLNPFPPLVPMMHGGPAPTPPFSGSNPSIRVRSHRWRDDIYSELRKMGLTTFDITNDSLTYRVNEDQMNMVKEVARRYGAKVEKKKSNPLFVNPYSPTYIRQLYGQKMLDLTRQPAKKLLSEYLKHRQGFWEATSEKEQTKLMMRTAQYQMALVFKLGEREAYDLIYEADLKRDEEVINRQLGLDNPCGGWKKYNPNDVYTGPHFDVVGHDVHIGKLGGKNPRKKKAQRKRKAKTKNPYLVVLNPEKPPAGMPQNAAEAFYDFFGKKPTVQEAKDFAKAYKAYIEFHGVEPEAIEKVNVPAGSPKYVVGVGDMENITYSVKWPSRRQKVLWDHRAGDHGKSKGKTKPVVIAADPRSGKPILAEPRGSRWHFKPSHGLMG